MSVPHDLWAGFGLDPRQQENAALRASDRDRALVHQLLADAYADGRLDPDELEERTAAADALKTYGEVPALVQDIVPVRPQPAALRDPATWAPDDVRREAARKYQDERRSAVLSFVGPTLICWAVWTATTFSDGDFEMVFPWPLIVMAATLFHMVQVLVQRRERTEAHVRRLERQQAKALRKAHHCGRHGGPHGGQGLPHGPTAAR